MQIRTQMTLLAALLVFASMIPLASFSTAFAATQSAGDDEDDDDDSRGHQADDDDDDDGEESSPRAPSAPVAASPDAGIGASKGDSQSAIPPRAAGFEAKDEPQGAEHEEQPESHGHLDVSAAWSQPLSRAARSASQVATSDYLTCCALGSSLTVDGGYDLTDHVSLSASETYVPGIGLFDPAVGFDFYAALSRTLELDAFIAFDLPLTDESRVTHEATVIAVGVTPSLTLDEWKLELGLEYSVGIFSGSGNEADAEREANEKEASFGATYKLSHKLGLTAKASVAHLAMTAGPDLYLAQIYFPGVTYKIGQTTLSATYMTSSLATKLNAPNLPFFVAGASYSFH